MKTVIYNTTTEEPGAIRSEPYTVDGQPGKLPDHLVELPVIYTERPSITDTQKRKSEWVVDLENMEYRQEWQVIDKTDYEIALEDWIYEDFEKRIIAPKSLGELYPGIETWFRLNEFPIKVIGEDVMLYCHTILKKHQNIIDEHADIITIEDRPVILDTS